MEPLLLWILVLVIALYILIKSADYFTEFAEKIGLLIGMSPFLIGLTIVAFGTSAPELATSIASVFRNSPEIVLGNVIGSNIANILLVLGIAVLIAGRIHLKFKFNKFDKMLLAASALLLLFFGIDGSIGSFESGILLLLYVIYIASIVISHKQNKIKKSSLRLQPFILLIFSGLVLYTSAELAVKSVINISGLIGLGKEIIAASVIAFGTSLPELVVSVTAVRKGKHGIAVGNILGSNIFNTLVVVSISGFLVSLPVTHMMASLGMIVMVLATFLFLFFVRNNKVGKWEGVVMLLIYLFFIFKLFNLL
ncbi:MAG: calcium/sodium antiporter [Nanoarchaeota archaeon]|nr:calcium/sodium antiporter [DPANN group archaeon]MBL7116413.1 calcium/sodium antiporter [Nanoarchaeota archaeon]